MYQMSMGIRYIREGTCAKLSCSKRILETTDIRFDVVEYILYVNPSNIRNNNSINAVINTECVGGDTNIGQVVFL